METKLFDSALIGRAPQDALGFLVNLLQSATDCALICEALDGTILLWNEGARRVYGYEVEEVLGKATTDMLYPRDDLVAGRPNAMRQAALQSGKWEGVLPQMHKSGGRLLARAVMTPRFDAAGQQIGYLFMARDITNEITAARIREKAAREKDEHIQLLLDSTGEAICEVDRDGHCTFANAACARLLGQTDPSRLIGKDIQRLIPLARTDGTPYPDEEYPIFQSCRRGQQVHVADDVVWRTDGARFPVEYWSYPIRRNGYIVGAVVTFLDITERKQMEEQFRQSQKMEAIGRLAAGVAHDFNNLLTVIIGYGEMLQARLSPHDPARELVQEMTTAGNRAAGLTPRELLAFSRKALVEPKTVDLRSIVIDMDNMLRRIIGEDVQWAVVADPDVGMVKADPSQMEQVILNLAVNARDAMPQGGKLTLEVRNVDLDETYMRDHSEARGGPHVMLAVSDTGCGMNAATLAHIWEPFFTTKGDRGTGSGLATVYGIIKQSGGHVTVHSEVEHGTTFKVYLPRVERRPAASKPHSGQLMMPRGRETVLLVEDEDGVRALTRRVLRDCGYTVLDAADGDEAARIARQHPQRIDLVVTDVVMPRMGGREVASRLTILHPEVKVLFLSGYTDDAVVRHGILEGEVAFLQKPFSPAVLAEKVREVLDSR